MNLVIRSLGSIIILLFRIQDKKKSFGKKHYIIPIYCLNFAYNILMNEQKFYTVDYSRAESLGFYKDKELKEWNI